MISDVDLEHGEQLQHTPLSGGAADASRSPVTVIGRLRTDEGNRPSYSNGRGEAVRVGQSGVAGEIEISIARYADLDVRRGDKFRALDRVGQPWFEVSRENNRSRGRRIIKVSAA